jgi:hypothetical protein
MADRAAETAWTCCIINKLMWGYLIYPGMPQDICDTNDVRISIHMHFRHIAAYTVSYWLEFNSLLLKFFLHISYI